MVSELRRRHRGRPIVADIKVIDAGEPIAELAFAAGATVVTVLGCAADEVIERVVRSAKRYDGQVMADSLSLSNVPERARQLRDLGVNSLCINRRGFKRVKGLSREERLSQLAELIDQIDLAKIGGFGRRLAGINRDSGSIMQNPAVGRNGGIQLGPAAHAQRNYQLDIKVTFRKNQVLLAEAGFVRCNKDSNELIFNLIAEFVSLVFVE